MKKLLFLTLCTALSLFSVAQNSKVINDKNAQTRNVKGFHAIEVSNGIDLYLSEGNEAVAVSARGVEDRDKIKTEVQSGILKIYMERGLHWGGGNLNLKAYVSFSALDHLKASGGSDVYIQDILRADKLDISLSGGSDLKGKLNIHDLSIDQSGGSDVDASGTVANLSVVASGGSDLSGYDLITEVCSITASGGSDARITVNKELNANASGGSDISYKGTAAVKEIRSGGSSSVTKSN